MNRRAKGGHESHGGDERWLVSYADFITLLMVMFVVLYSMGQVDVQKYKQLAQSFRAAFMGGGTAKVVDAQIDQNGGTQSDGQPNPIVVPGIPKSPPQSEEVAGQLTTMLASSDLGSEVSVQTNIEGILISLSEKLLFEQGTAHLQQEAFPILDTIIGMLKSVDNSIRVVGYTDDSTPTDPKYPSNWDLSLGRALMIANYMMNAGIAPERMSVTGRGQYEPIFPNDTQAHRALNSRADIVIIYRVNSDVIGTGITGFLYRTYFAQTQQTLSLETFPNIEIPVLSNLPFFGEILVKMNSVAGAVPERLGHQGDDEAVPGGQILYDEFILQHRVGDLQGRPVVDVDLVFAFGRFVVALFGLDPGAGQGGGHFLADLVSSVVGRRGEVVGFIIEREMPVLFLHQPELQLGDD